MQMAALHYPFGGYPLPRVTPFVLSISPRLVVLSYGAWVTKQGRYNDSGQRGRREAAHSAPPPSLIY